MITKLCENGEFGLFCYILANIIDSYCRTLYSLSLKSGLGFFRDARKKQDRNCVFPGIFPEVLWKNCARYHCNMYSAATCSW